MTIYLGNVVAYSLQLTVLVAAACAITAALRLRTPRLSLGFWQVVMGIAIALPLIQPRIESVDGFLLSSTVSDTVAIAEAAPMMPAGIDVVTIAVFVIAAGIAIRLLWLVMGMLRLRAMVAHAHRDDAIMRVIEDLHTSIGARAVVMISDDVAGPATIGVRHPIILLPRAVVEMPAAVQRAILCHELVHVRRRDWLATIVEEIWCALAWFHPAARLVASRLSLARETVVDEITIRLTRDRRAYAEALLAFSDPQPHLIGATPFIGRRTLSQRISLIAQEVPMSRFRALATLVGALTVAGSITVLAVDHLPMSSGNLTQSAIYEPGNGVTLPVVTYEVKPQYTKQAMQAQIQGSVWMKVVIGSTGDVTDVQISRSLDKEYGLDDMALEAARQWKFKPGTKDGKPVAVRVTVEMTFTLKK